MQGYVYQLRQHLERLADSAAKAGIDSPVSMSQMERIVLETAAASRLLNGQSVRPLGPSSSAFPLCLHPSLCYLIAFICMPAFPLCLHSHEAGALHSFACLAES